MSRSDRPDVADCRRYARVEPDEMTAVVHARSNQTAVFAVESVSAGGAQLVGHLPLARGERIQVMLALGGQTLAVAAEILRIEPRDHGIGVAVVFRELSTTSADRLQHMLEEHGSTCEPLEVDA